MSKYLYRKLIADCWWNVIDDHVLLGGIPLHNFNHLNSLQEIGVGAVLCLLEDFEIHPTMHFRPVSKADWEAHGITFMQISVEDSYGLQDSEIERAVDFLTTQINQGKKVYVHCKAGKGRSSSVVLCYLLRKQGATTPTEVADTYQYLKSRRHMVDINERQMMGVYEWCGTE